MIVRRILKSSLGFRPNRFLLRSMSSSEEVIFNVQNRAGIVTLNKPKALNSLNLNMVRLMNDQLEKWKKDDLKLIVVEGSGDKAFCAGGDIRAITNEKGSQFQKDFFKEEYILDNATANQPVPYIALINGIVMGGGVGISVHGPIRVATEKTVFAMPETGIGLIPDVGGSHFLSRLDGQMGMYLALTGQRLKGADCLHAGVATHLCQSQKIPELKEKLINVNDVTEIEGILDSYSKAFANSPFSLQDKLPMIEQAFSGETVEKVLDELSNLGNEWGDKTRSLIEKMSPTSVKVTFRQIREGAKLSSLAECLQMEYRLVRRCCEDHDFYEGVRALLVDKDNSPNWNPKSLSQVTDDAINRYFSELPKNEELKL